MAKRGLGRGLDALIPKQDAGGKPARDIDPELGAVELALSKIDPSPWQPRRDFDERKLASLADSINEQGLVQPIVVRARGKRYQLVAGERRLRAVKMLRWKKVPAVVLDKSDAAMRELALVENLQRDDLGPLEVAAAYKALVEEQGLTHEQIGRRLGVSRARVTNTLRLLELPNEVKEILNAGGISAGHGRSLLGLPDALSRIQLARRIAKERLSVREVERLLERRKGGKRVSGAGSEKPGKQRPVSPQIRDLEDRLRRHLGTKVKVQDRKGKGSIVIEYYGPADIVRIMRKMGCPGELDE